MNFLTNLDVILGNLICFLFHTKKKNETIVNLQFDLLVLVDTVKLFGFLFHEYARP